VIEDNKKTFLILGGMFMAEIRCSVSNCNHWGQGNFCQANSIIVHGDAENSTSTSQSFQNSIFEA
jgi:hypothetical protein